MRGANCKPQMFRDYCLKVKRIKLYAAPNGRIVGDKGNQLQWVLCFYQSLYANQHAGFYKLKDQQMSTSQGSLDLSLFWMFRSVPCHPTGGGGGYFIVLD